MKLFKKSIYCIFALFLFISLFHIHGCSDSSDDIFQQSSQLSIGIADDPCTDLFSEVNVTFSSFTIVPVDELGNPAGEPIQLVPEGGAEPINILDYIYPNYKEVPFNVDLEPGTYEIVSVTISAVTVASDDPDIAPLVPELNALLAQRIPAEGRVLNCIGNLGFTVLDDKTTTVILDISINCDSLLSSFSPTVEVKNTIHR